QAIASSALTDLCLPAFLSFFAFALFHSLTAQDWFKAWLGRMTSPFLVDHFWRFVYCMTSYYFLGKAFGFFTAFSPVYSQELLLFSSGFWVFLHIISIFGSCITVIALLQLDYLEFLGLRPAAKGLALVFRGERGTYTLPPPRIITSG